MNDLFEIRLATKEDVPLVLSFIKELADYEMRAHEVVATESLLEEALFGPRAHTEAVIGYFNREPVSFALFFHNFSTFLGRSGLYLEDLFVKPEAREKGVGRKTLAYLAKLAIERKCGRLDLSVLNWNELAINFYKRLGATPQHEWTGYRLTGDALNKLAGLSSSAISSE